PKLFAALQAEFESAYEAGLVESGFRAKNSEEDGHGRNEIRHYVSGPITDAVREHCAGWAGAKSIGQAINVTTKDGKETIETRYYISSRPPKVSEFANSVRKHWGIESM